MGYDLTNEQIQNTYQQLVQVSGSTLLDGTGSVLSVSFPSASYADYAVTASYAINVPTIDTSSLVTNTTFNAYTSSNDSSVAGKLETSTFNTYTSSVDSSLSTKLDTTTFNSYTSSNDSVVNALVSATSSYLTSLPSGVVSSSAQTVSNLQGQVVSVDTLNAQSASIGHIDFVTGSATIIGDAFIILNNALPTLPKGGISVVDTGSATTSSFFWDGENDDWMYEYHLGGDHEQAVALFGSGSAIGSPNYPTNNKIQKGTGTHHLHDSSISDDGSTIDMTSATLLKAPSNLVGGGAPSVGGNRRFVFANGSSTSVDDSVILGGETNDISSAFNAMFGASGTTISSGDLSVVVGGYQHTINGGARNVTIGGESVTNNQDYAIVLGRKSFTTPTAYTTYVANLDVSGSTSIVDGAGATGSLVDNIHPTIASSSAQIKHIVTITQDQYTSLSGSAGVTDDTLYIISDATDNVYPTSLQVEGQIYSPTFAGSIASATSSIDFDNGNFATLNCASSTFVANPSNLKSGTTYTLIVTNGANISGYGTTFKFAGGTAPTLSAGTDIITMVSDGTSLYATALADFQ